MAADTLSIDRAPRPLEALRNSLRAGVLAAVRQRLPDQAIVQACRTVEYSYRDRRIGPILTVLHALLAALWPEHSFWAAWTVLWSSAVTGCPEAAGKSPSSGSVTKARKRLPRRVWEQIHQGLVTEAQRVTSRWDTWHGHRVVIGDGTCVATPATPALQSAFGGSPRKDGTLAVPVARMVALALMGTRLILTWAVGTYRTAETTLLRPLLDRLQKGDLLLLDRLFAGANAYAGYLAQGLEFLTRIHQRLRVDRLPMVKDLGAEGRVVRLTVGKSYRKTDDTLPATVTVRLVPAVLTVRGKRVRTWLVTSLLDPVRYPAQEIVALYARRWRIETHFRDLKVALGVDVVRSETAEGVRKELAARVCAANLLRSVMREAGERADVDPGRLSVAAAGRALMVFSCAMRVAPMRDLPPLYEALLVEIAAHRVPERPDRNEPRMVRRDRRSYPILRSSRSAWRARQGA